MEISAATRPGLLLQAKSSIAGKSNHLRVIDASIRLFKEAERTQRHEMSIREYT